MDTGFYDPELYTKTAADAEGPAIRLLDIIEKHFQKYSSDQSDLILVDFGCGPGNTVQMILDRFPDARQITGIDIDASMIRYARQTSKSEKFQFFEVDLSSPWSQWPPELRQFEGKVDAIFSNFTIHWIDEVKTMALNIPKLLKQNGIFAGDLSYCDNLAKNCKSPGQLEWLRTRFHFPSESEFLSKYLLAFRDAGFSTIQLKHQPNICHFSADDYRQHFIKMPIRWMRKYLLPTSENVCSDDDETTNAKIVEFFLQTPTRTYRDTDTNIEMFEFKQLLWTFSLIKE